MTRINVVPVDSLTDKHLLAEYRELPRVFKLARADANIPPTYRTGKGHVTFFYDKLTYLFHRFNKVYDEMCKREFNISPLYVGYVINVYAQADASLKNDWIPTKEAIAINTQRIEQRLREAEERRLVKENEKRPSYAVTWNGELAGNEHDWNTARKFINAHALRNMKGSSVNEKSAFIEVDSDDEPTFYRGIFVWEDDIGNTNEYRIDLRE